MSESPLEDRLREAIAPQYYLVRKLGAGAMGTVFLALEPSAKRTLAVKVLAPEFASEYETRMRFEREARAVATLDHPNVIRVYSVGEMSDGVPYFVMQYVTGRSVGRRVLKTGPLSLAEVRQVIREVASGLAAAHAKGIVHRDIKPDNILFDDELRRTIISDFGVAALLAPLDGVADVKLTAAGASVGTVGYMSPEAMMAEPVTDRTDMYALGLMGFELVAGRPAFEAKTQHALIMAHLTQEPPRLSSLRPEVDRTLDEVVWECLSKDAEARPTAADVAARLA